MKNFVKSSLYQLQQQQINWWQKANLDVNKEAKTVHNKRPKQVKAFEKQLLII